LRTGKWENGDLDIVDLAIDSMVDLSIVFCMFTRPGLGIFDACWG